MIIRKKDCSSCFNKICDDELKRIAGSLENGYHVVADEPYSHAEGYYSSTGNLYPVIGKVDNCIYLFESQPVCGPVIGYSSVETAENNCIVKVTPMLNSTYQVRFEFPFSIEVSYIVGKDSDIGSHAEGSLCVASNKTSHAEGFMSLSLDQYCHAEGLSTISVYDGSHAEGSQTVAGLYNNPVGVYGILGQNTVQIQGNIIPSVGNRISVYGPLDRYSDTFTIIAVVVGSSTNTVTLSGTLQYNVDYAVVLDNNIVTKPIASHAEGMSTIVNQNYAHVEGLFTRALGDSSHAEGRGTITTGLFDHAEGYYSLSGFTPIPCYGAVGQNLIYISPTLNITPGSNIYMYSISNSRSISGTVQSYTPGTITMFDNLTYKIEYLATSDYLASSSSGARHAEGYGSIAVSIASHAEGVMTRAYSIGDHSEGMFTAATGGLSHAEGYATSTGNFYCHSEGYGSMSGYNLYHIRGTQGTNTVTVMDNITVPVGMEIILYNLNIGIAVNTLVLSVSGITLTLADTLPADVFYGTVPGLQYARSAISAHSEGTLTIASGQASHAEGAGTYALGAYSHAEGVGSYAFLPAMKTLSSGGFKPTMFISQAYEIHAYAQQIATTSVVVSLLGGVTTIPLHPDTNTTFTLDIAGASLTAYFKGKREFCVYCNGTLTVSSIETPTPDLSTIGIVGVNVYPVTSTSIGISIATVTPETANWSIKMSGSMVSIPVAAY